MTLHTPQRSAVSKDRGEATDGLREQVHGAARRARVAARGLATLSTEVKNRALHTAADPVLMNTRAILAANEADLDAARAAGTAEAMLDRLALNPARIEASPPGCGKSPACPTRSVRCCGDGRCPTVCRSASSAFRSAWSAWSTRAGPTSRSTRSG